MVYRTCDVIPYATFKTGKFTNLPLRQIGTIFVIL